MQNLTNMIRCVIIRIITYVTFRLYIFKILATLTFIDISGVFCVAFILLYVGLFLFTEITLKEKRSNFMKHNATEKEVVIKILLVDRKTYQQ